MRTQTSKPSSGPLLFPFWETLLGYKVPSGESGCLDGEAYSYIRRAYLAIFLVCLIEFFFWGNFFYVMGYDYIEQYIKLPSYITIRDLIKSVLAAVTAIACLVLLAWIGAGIYPIDVAIQKFRSLVKPLSDASTELHKADTQSSQHTQKTDATNKHPQLSVATVLSMVGVLLLDYLAFQRPVWPSFADSLIMPIRELSLFDYKIYISPVTILLLATIFSMLIGILDVTIVLSPLAPIGTANDSTSNDPTRPMQKQAVVAILTLVLITVILTPAIISSDPAILSAAFITAVSIVIVAVLAWVIANHDIKTAVPLLLRIPLIVLIGWVTSRLTDPIAFMDSIQERHVQYESEQVLGRIYDRFMSLGAPPRVEPGFPLFDRTPRGDLQTSFATCLAKPAAPESPKQPDAAVLIRPGPDAANSLQKEINGRLHSNCLVPRFDIEFSLQLDPSQSGCTRLHQERTVWQKVVACISNCQQQYYNGFTECDSKVENDTCSQLLASHGLPANTYEPNGAKPRGIGVGWGRASCKMQAQLEGWQIIEKACEVSFQDKLRKCENEEPFKRELSLHRAMKSLFMVARDSAPESPEEDLISLYKVKKQTLLAKNRSWRSMVCKGTNPSEAQENLLNQFFCIQRKHPDIQKRLQYYHEIKAILEAETGEKTSSFSMEDADSGNVTLLQSESRLWPLITKARQTHIAELLYILLIVGGLGELIVLLMKFFMPDRIKRYLLRIDVVPQEPFAAKKDGDAQ